MDARDIVELADAYKLRLFDRLRDRLPERLRAFRGDALKGQAADVLTYAYLQGVQDALDAFDMAELLRLIARESGAAGPGLQA
ncbi:hypothetical protein [Truepera radiovictrix]|uniref:Uncharacterized protein n=1 Tax=Truepera radiovictrix (strain DSM 17093 / CIP 108686 / LMG 22925 / RQ-24) TaxID=649638 RepID=D7CTR7_TRURR|nr:hypothetical protein [Truepera radiovictrix]ADI15614.1 conserved hypothetical protein [Truepera radiovictrix DSM 17093]WMT58757.1 hypothetical protein RCV51_07370 [Truepera radiovictrix]